MPTIRFTQNIQRHLACPSREVKGATVREALEFLPPEIQYEPNGQDPHLMVQCPANPAVLWVQHHNGIFRSTDAARSWTEIEGAGKSPFGFPVENGGDSWHALSSNLPPIHAVVFEK